MIDLTVLVWGYLFPIGAGVYIVVGIIQAIKYHYANK